MRGPAEMTAPAYIAVATHAPPGCVTMARRVAMPVAKHRHPSVQGAKQRRLHVSGRTDPYLAHGNIHFGQLRVSELTPHEDTGKHVTDFLGHAQLALRWSR